MKKGNGRVLWRWEWGQGLQEVAVAFRAPQRGGEKVEKMERDKNGTEEGREKGEEGEDYGGRVSEVAERTPGHRGRLFSALPRDECDRHANSGQHPCPPSNPGTQPSHGPQGHQDGARTGGVGLGVHPDTTRTPLPCLSLGCRPVPFWDLGGRVGKGGERA